jgi:acetylornithine deacetylase/succinyl-diaminopimelate desuccinylase-like protein
MRYCVFSANCFMDIDFFCRILSLDSTSGKEAELADLLSVEFATHLDTVPPYIPPCCTDSPCHPERSEGSSSETIFYGRGTCDAKGQIFAMWEACKQLEAKGCTDFGLLLLAGEETGSFGAKAFREQHPGAGDFSKFYYLCQYLNPAHDEHSSISSAVCRSNVILVCQ